MDQGLKQLSEKLAELSFLLENTHKGMKNGFSREKSGILRDQTREIQDALREVKDIAAVHRSHFEKKQFTDLRKDVNHIEQSCKKFLRTDLAFRETNKIVLEQTAEFAQAQSIVESIKQSIDKMKDQTAA